MPTAAEQFAARHVDSIPGLALLFRPDALAELIGRHLGGAVRDLVLEPTYIRIKPGSSCLVAYQGRSGELYFRCSVKAVSHGNSVKLEKFMQRSTVPGPFGPGRIVCDEQLLVVWFFPNDNALRSLRRYMSDQPDMRTLAYKPERRFVGLLNGAGCEREVLKIYKRSAFAHACRLAAVADGIDCLPDLAGVDAARHALRLRWVEGRTLSEAIRSGDDAHHHGEDAGALLATLHERPPPSGLQRHAADRDHQRLRSLAAGLVALCPESSALVERIADGLGNGLAGGDGNMVLAHGDFYANQVLLSEAGPRLLDFDELTVAPAEGDIGLFLAHLQFDVLRNRLSQADCDRLADAFMRGYSAHRTADRHLVELHALYGMFQLAHRPFRDQMTAWPSRTVDWLELIANRLDALHATAGTAGLSAAQSAPSPLTGVLAERIRRALDPHDGGAAVEQALAELGAPYEHMRIHQAAELRQKPGRRAVISYELFDTVARRKRRVLGKVRAKGLDTRTFVHNVRLYALTAVPANDAPLKIPRPLAALPETNMWLQEWIEGSDGWEVLDTQDAGRAAKNIAHSLHQLHALSGPLEKQHSWRDELAILTQRLAAAGDELSTCRPRIDSLLRNCQRIAQHLADRPTCGIHRDFYPDQVILKDNDVYMLDLDLHCQGDPAIDIGNFIAHVQERDLRNSGNPYQHRDFYGLFAGTYYGKTADQKLPLAADVYRVLTLARHVHISTQFADRRPYSLDILTFCEEEIARVTERIPPTMHTREIDS